MYVYVDDVQVQFHTQQDMCVLILLLPYLWHRVFVFLLAKRGWKQATHTNPTTDLFITRLRASIKKMDYKSASVNNDELAELIIHKEIYTVVK